MTNHKHSYHFIFYLFSYCNELKLNHTKSNSCLVSHPNNIILYSKKGANEWQGDGKKEKEKSLCLRLYTTSKGWLGNGRNN